MSAVQGVVECLQNVDIGWQMEERGGLGNADIGWQRAEGVSENYYITEKNI